MRYKSRIVPENGGYVGYALLNDEVVFTTNVHKDAIMAAREISSHIDAASQQPTPSNIPAQMFMKSSTETSTTDNIVPAKRTNSSHPAPIQAPFPQPPIQRKCCGRS